MQVGEHPAELVEEVVVVGLGLVGLGAGGFVVVYAQEQVTQGGVVVELLQHRQHVADVAYVLDARIAKHRAALQIISSDYFRLSHGRLQRLGDELHQRPGNLRPALGHPHQQIIHTLPRIGPLTRNFPPKQAPPPNLLNHLLIDPIQLHLNE